MLNRFRRKTTARGGSYKKHSFKFNLFIYLLFVRIHIEIFIKVRHSCVRYQNLQFTQNNNVLVQVQLRFKYNKCFTHVPTKTNNYNKDRKIS